MALFEFRLNNIQFQQLLAVEKAKAESLQEIKNSLASLVTATETGFAAVGEAISDLQIPDLPPGEADDSAVEGRLMARYILNEDEVANNPGPKTFTIVGTGFKSRAGTPVGAQDVDLNIELIGSNMTASVANQRLSADGNSVEADVTIEGKAQQPTAELAVLKYSGRNRDTGNEVAADTDEFVTGPGEASIGTIDSPVPLTEVPAEPGGGETGGGETGGGTAGEGGGTDPGVITGDRTGGTEGGTGTGGGV